MQNFDKIFSKQVG